MIEIIQKKKIKNKPNSQKKREFLKKFNHKVVQIKRVSKVVKGGKKLSFRVIVIVGIDNLKGVVGIGIGKADDVKNAIDKGISNGKKNLINIPITKLETIPHSVLGIFGASSVIIKPSILGSGVIAGSSIRTVLEVAGIKNILAKQIGSNNLLNSARATINALMKLKTISQVAKDRDVTIDSLYKN
jgi:small subunit ribosomal protein S5